jgi:hypothetical protein
LYCVDTLPFFIKAINAYRDFVYQNRLGSSIFLIESLEKVPIKLIINREAVGALLSIAIQLALASTKKKGVSIYITWKPKNSQSFDRMKRPIQIDPVFEIKPLSESSFSSLNRQIDKKMMKLALQNEADEIEMVPRPHADKEFTPIINQAEIYGYNFMPTRDQFSRYSPIATLDSTSLKKSDKLPFTASFKEFTFEKEKARSQTNQVYENALSTRLIRKPLSEKVEKQQNINSIITDSNDLERLLNKVERWDSNKNQTGHSKDRNYENLPMFNSRASADSPPLPMGSNGSQGMSNVIREVK